MEAARFAGRTDVERVVELSGALRAELEGHRGGDLWVRTQPGASWTAEAVHTLVAAGERTPEACVVVGTVDDTVVGYGMVTVLALTDGGRLGRLTELFVEPGAREVGVGEAMVVLLRQWCADRGCEGIDATALPGHRAAKNFFEEQGFVARSLTMHRPLTDGAPPRPTEG